MLAPQPGCWWWRNGGSAAWQPLLDAQLRQQQVLELLREAGLLQEPQLQLALALEVEVVQEVAGQARREEAEPRQAAGGPPHCAAPPGALHPPCCAAPGEQQRAAWSAGGFKLGCHPGRAQAARCLAAM